MDCWIEQARELGPSPERLGAMLEARGGRIVALHQNFLTEPAYEIELPSHAAKVALLDDLASYDAEDPGVRRWAEVLVSDSYGDAHRTAQELHRHVREGVTFAPEKVETFQHTLRTLGTQRGDCDDSVRALAALARSIGVPARLVTMGDPPTHVWAQLGVAGVWWDAETTLPHAQLGEHPLAAKARSGAARQDIQR